MMAAHIVLIGPMGAGKSTVATLLADRLGRRRCELDELRWTYYNEVGFDRASERQAWERDGIQGVIRYWQPFEVYAVERVLADYDSCVIDFGGGYTIPDDPDLSARVRAALTGQPAVFLLLPSPDLDESVAILRERTAGMVPDDFDLRAHVLRHMATDALAAQTIYTRHRSPQATCDEILAALARMNIDLTLPG